MGRLINLIIQKIVPGAKKSIWIEFRKKNGAWTSFLLAPSKKKFTSGGMDYYVQGIPEIEDFTNQRRYYFVQGVSMPLDFNTRHPELITINKEQGNIAMALTEAEEIGFQKAMLLKSKKGMDPLFIITIITALTLLACLLGFYMLYGQVDSIITVLKASGIGT